MPLSRTFLSVALCALLSVSAAGQITVDGTSSGKTFEGVGGVFGNGMARLLKDYPATQRQDVMNLLFKKKYGAGLQHVKIEIGTDVNSSAGTEPSHMRSSTDNNINRGMLLWLAQQAKATNPAITLDALRWGTPAWVTTDAQKYTFYKNYLQGASSTFGLSFNYLGPDQNEGSFSRDWVVNTLRPGLNADGFSGVTLVAADQVGSNAWGVATTMLTDTALRSALGAVTAHYIEDSTADAQTLQSSYSKKLWAGEDLAPSRNSYLNTVDMVYRIVKSYASGRMTKYEMDPGVEASYANLPFAYKSMLITTWPWSGHYEVASGLWGAAHVTQFADPGWKYLDTACAANADVAYMALKDSGSSNWSMVFVNYSAMPLTYTVNVTGGLSTSALHVWKTDETSWFQQQADISQSSGSFSITLAPYAIYSVTTTTGQVKGSPTSVPAATALSLPYTEDFESYGVDTQPKYFIDQGGAFEVVTGNGGKILQQRIAATMKPVDWTHLTTPNPFTVVGSTEWRNYNVQVDAKIADSAGYILLGGRTAHLQKSIAPDTLPDGYSVQVNYDGTWILRNKQSTVVTGTIASFTPGSWHTYRMRFNDSNVKFYLDGTQLADQTVGYVASGNVILGSSYNTVQFDNLSVTAIDSSTPVDTTRTDDRDAKLLFQGEWETQDGSYDVLNRTLSAGRHAGATLDVAFNGTSVSLLGNRSVNGGQANVYVDGNFQQTIDVYKDTSADLDASGNIIPYRHQAIFTKNGMTSGPHTLHLDVLGTKQSAATDSYVWVDGVEVVGTGVTAMGSMTTNVVSQNFDGMASLPSDGWNVTAGTSTSASIVTDPSPGRTGKSIKLVDSSTSASVSAVKKFTPLGGNFSVSFAYRTTATGNWNRALIKHLSTIMVGIYDLPGGLAYDSASGTKTTFASISPNNWYTIRIDMNMAAHTFELYLNGTHTVFAAPMMSTTYNTADRVWFESGSSFTGTSYWDDAAVSTSDVYQRVYVNDSFDNQPGITAVANWNAVDDPVGWGVSVSPYIYPAYSENANVFARVDSTLPGAGDQSLLLYDDHSTKAINAQRRFPLTADRTVTLTYRFQVNAVGKKMTMAMRAHSDEALKIVDSATQGLAYVNGGGTEVKIMDIVANHWYTVQVVANPVYDTFDVSVDGALLVSDQPMMNTNLTAGLDNVIFYSDATTSGSTMHVDGLTVSAP